MEEIKEGKESAQETQTEVDFIRESELATANEEIKAPVLTEIVKGYKTVNIANHGEVTITRPTFFVMEEGDKIAASAKRKMLLDKDNPLPTESELRKLYAKREAWSQADEDRIDYLRTKIVAIVKEINDWPNDLDEIGWWNDNMTDEFAAAVGLVATHSEDPEIPQSVLDNYDTLRENILNELQKEHNAMRTARTELFSGTVESFANFERQLYFIIKCFKKNGEQVWKSIEDLKGEDPQSFSQIVSIASRFWSGVDTEEMDTFFDALQGEPM